MKTKFLKIAFLFLVSTKITIAQNSQIKPLSWERNHPERKAWSEYTIKTIDSLFDTSFSKCEDMLFFRTDYNSLNKNQKINVWAELISAMTKYESGWKSTAWMTETTMKIDSVTQKQVKSEGLLQLSYQDKLSYPKLPCRFNWENDKILNQNDPRKTIFDPYINLEFGINILANQIRLYKNIALTKNVYWSVIKKGGKYTKIPEITKMVQSLKL